MKLRLFISFLILAAGASSSSCSRNGESALVLDPVQPSRAETELTCLVEVHRELGPVHAGLWGTNLEWFNQANDIVKKGQFDRRLVQLAREQGITSVRFPGGTLSDFYFWRDGIGHPSKRPMRDHPTDPGRSPNVFGTPELHRFCTAIGAQPLITVNAGTSTPEDAAAWVEYCNAPNHKEREADGIREPMGVKLWEVGNELYLPGNPGDKKKITVGPEEYASRYLRFAAAMRAKDPSIQLMAIAVANPTRLPLPYPDWTPKLLEKAAHEIDFVAVHPAYFPYLINEKKPSPRDVYQALLAAPEAVDRTLTDLEKLIAKHEKGRDIGIAITEWGMLFSAEKEWVDHVKTMGSSVYAARILQVFLNHPKVRVANYFKFTDRSLMGWVSYTGVPKIPYYVVQLFTQHYGTTRIAASFEAQPPRFSSRTLGATYGEKDVPEVTVVASIDATKKKLFINLVNRSWDKIHRVRLKSKGAKLQDAAIAWSISSAGIMDHNGRDMPPEFPIPWQEPPLHPKTKGTVGISQASISLADAVEIPPFSVMTVEVALQQ